MGMEQSATIVRLIGAFKMVKTLVLSAAAVILFEARHADATPEAIRIVEHLGIDPERLASAIQKTIRYNDWLDRNAGATSQTAAAVTADRYVSLRERLAFIRTVATLHWADGRPVPQAAAVR